MHAGIGHMGYPGPPLDMVSPRHGTGTPLDMGLGPPQIWDWDPPGHGTRTPPDMGLG